MKRILTFLLSVLSITTVMAEGESPQETAQRLVSELYSSLSKGNLETAAARLGQIDELSRQKPLLVLAIEDRLRIAALLRNTELLRDQGAIRGPRRR